MKRKSTKSALEIDYNQIAKVHEDIMSDNVIVENAAKPISLHPLKFDAAVAALLKVKPEPKAKPKE